MLEQRVQQHFFDSADLRYQAAESLGKPLAEAAQAVFGCLTAGGKLLVGGIGASALLVPIASALLVGRFERDRPGLAAVALPGGAGSEAAAALARQVRALGQPGDVLLLFASTPQAPSASAVVEAAHAVEMSVVMLAGQGSAPGGWSETDVFVEAPHEREARVVELHLLMLQCLCDAVDVQLMGDQDTP
jgi:D-sedoheptulose 7-phosphate isomerase